MVATAANIAAYDRIVIRSEADLRRGEAMRVRAQAAHVRAILARTQAVLAKVRMRELRRQSPQQVEKLSQRQALPVR